MAALVRLAFLVALVGLIALAVVSYLRSAGRATRQTREPEAPYCLRCETNRHVVGRPQDAPGRGRWLCTRCRESF